MKHTSRRLLIAAFALYSAFMLWLLFGQRLAHILASPPSTVPYLEALSGNLNLIPFHTVSAYLTDLATGSIAIARHAFINLGGNLLLFVPLGFFLSMLFKKLRSLPRFLAVTTAVLLTVELIQLFTLLGSFDIDDLILNLCGALLGYIVMRAIKMLSKSGKKPQKTA